MLRTQNERKAEKLHADLLLLTSDDLRACAGVAVSDSAGASASALALALAALPVTKRWNRSGRLIKNTTSPSP